MMHIKKYLKAWMLIPALVIASCSKDKLTPGLGLNSNLKIGNIKVNNLSGSPDVSVQGTVLFAFVKPNDTNSNIMDTIRAVDTFSLPTTNGYTQSFNFASPAGSKYLNLDISFYITDGAAESITIDNLEMDYNDKKYINSNGLILSNSGSNYFLPTQHVTY
jgi:hypothetical protein